jgi:hypothetical protein
MRIAAFWFDRDECSALSPRLAMPARDVSKNGEPRLQGSEQPDESGETSRSCGEHGSSVITSRRAGRRLSRSRARKWWLDVRGGARCGVRAARREVVNGGGSNGAPSEVQVGSMRAWRHKRAAGGVPGEF